jgi:hypothetical protein
MNSAEKALRAMRLVHIGLVFAAAAYLAVPWLVGKPMMRKTPMAMILALGAVAFASLAGAGLLRARLLPAAGEALRRNADDAGAIQRWRAVVLLSLALSETAVLFGLALRLAGAPGKVCAIFYGAGIFLLLAWTPRLDLPPS